MRPAASAAQYVRNRTVLERRPHDPVAEPEREQHLGRGRLDGHDALRGGVELDAARRSSRRRRHWARCRARPGYSAPHTRSAREEGQRMRRSPQRERNDSWHTFEAGRSEASSTDSFGPPPKTRAVRPGKRTRRTCVPDDRPTMGRVTDSAAPAGFAAGAQPAAGSSSCRCGRRARAGWGRRRSSRGRSRWTRSRRRRGRRWSRLVLVPTSDVVLGSALHSHGEREGRRGGRAPRDRRGHPARLRGRRPGATAGCVARGSAVARSGGAGCGARARGRSGAVVRARRGGHRHLARDGSCGGRADRRVRRRFGGAAPRGGPRRTADRPGLNAAPRRGHPRPAGGRHRPGPGPPHAIPSPNPLVEEPRSQTRWSRSRAAAPPRWSRSRAATRPKPPDVHVREVS